MWWRFNGDALVYGWIASCSRIFYMAPTAQRLFCLHLTSVWCAGAEDTVPCTESVSHAGRLTAWLR